MKKEGKITIFVLLLIVVIVLLVNFFIEPEKIIQQNHNVFFVDDEFDDARTFKIVQANIMSETEHGKWATLQLSPTYSFGVKFNNITIPKNAEIIDVYIELFSTGTPGLDHPNCNIYCDYVDNAVNFSTIGVLNISGRNYTTNYTLWNTTVDYGKWVKTPSIKKQFTEIISRKNWTSGNSIAFLFVTNGYSKYSATFQNYEKDYPAKLSVIWQN